MITRFLNIMIHPLWHAAIVLSVYVALTAYLLMMACNIVPWVSLFEFKVGAVIHTACLYIGLFSLHRASKREGESKNYDYISKQQTGP